MKSRQILVFLIVLALLDDFIRLAFPVDFRFYGYSFIPHLSFAFLMLLVYDKKIMDRILICALCGIISSMLFYGNMIIELLLYVLSGLLVGFLQTNMENDVRIRFFVTLGLVFLLDFIPFCFSSWSNVLNVSLSRWFIHHELLTISLHVVIILVLMYSLDVYRRYNVIRDHRKKIQERKHYFKIRQS